MGGCGIGSGSGSVIGSGSGSGSWNKISFLFLDHGNFDLHFLVFDDGNGHSSVGLNWGWCRGVNWCCCCMGNWYMNLLGSS